jgi:hypothetical protein
VFFKFKIGKEDQITAKGIAIKAGNDATVLFDPETPARHGDLGPVDLSLSRAVSCGGLEGQIKPGGELAFTNAQVPGWSAGDIGEDPRKDRQGNAPGLKGWRAPVHDVAKRSRAQLRGAGSEGPGSAGLQCRDEGFHTHVYH